MRQRALMRSGWRCPRSLREIDLARVSVVADLANVVAELARVSVVARQSFGRVGRHTECAYYSFVAELSR